MRISHACPSATGASSNVAVDRMTAGVPSRREPSASVRRLKILPTVTGIHLNSKIRRNIDEIGGCNGFSFILIHLSDSRERFQLPSKPSFERDANSSRPITLVWRR